MKPRISVQLIRYLLIFILLLPWFLVLGYYYLYSMQQQNIDLLWQITESQITTIHKLELEKQHYAELATMNLKVQFINQRLTDRESANPSANP